MTRSERFKAALDQILELTMVLNDDMAKFFAGTGLTTSRMHLLWVLRQRGPSTQRELAEALEVSARNITGLVDALVDTGFVTREPHPRDRRATLVTFTKHGTATTEAMARDHIEFANILFSSMPKQRFDSFVEGLSDVLKRLKEVAER